MCERETELPNTVMSHLKNIVCYYLNVAVKSNHVRWYFFAFFFFLVAVD